MSSSMPCDLCLRVPAPWRSTKRKHKGSTIVDMRCDLERVPIPGVTISLVRWKPRGDRGVG